MATKRKLRYNGIPVPENGEWITMRKGKLIVPNRPIIPFIHGDGIGKEISPVVIKIIEEACRLVGDGRMVEFYEVFAGDTAMEKFGTPLPKGTLRALKKALVSIKGPLGTPSGGGFKSLNVFIRNFLDAYQCIRPFHYIKGAPSPMVRPEDVDAVLFRQNDEDIYQGIEYPKGSKEAKKIIKVAKKLGHKIPKDSGVGIKFESERGAKRIVRAAIRYAMKHDMPSITLVAKGNINKYTEGAFRAWGYEVARDEFGEDMITEEDLWNKHGGEMPPGKNLVRCMVINDRITDAMFANMLLKPKRYYRGVIVTMNMNGDYLSDALAAEHGGLGFAGAANKGDKYFNAEAVHGTGPDIAGQNLANPISMIQSGNMMLNHIEFSKEASLIEAALAVAIERKLVTFDAAQVMDERTQLAVRKLIKAMDKGEKSFTVNFEELKPECTVLGTKEFGDKVIEIMRELAPAKPAEEKKVRKTRTARKGKKTS